jgi:starch synthase
VRHYDPATGVGTGCVFNDYDAPAVEWGLNTALEWYHHPDSWRRLIENAMLEDFSWDRQINQYVELFRAARSAR